MKIIIDGRLLSRRPTGISRYTQELIISYQNLYGIENVFIICHSNSDIKLSNVIYTKFKPFNIFDFIRFYFFINKYKFDIYHSAFYSGLIFKVKNVTNIITVHDLMFYKVPQFFSTNRFVNFCAKFYYQILVGISLRNADIIVSVSKTTSNDLHCIYGLDSIVIGEGVFNFKIGDNNSIERLNILSSYCLSPKDYFLYIGNNRRHKNIKFLISAFMASNTCHKLVLVGFTESKFERNSKIINISSVTDDELAAFYINCVAFIFPSLYEGFGLPILEAIKHRCVVLSSNGGALEEFNFKSIHFFDPKSEYELVELINCSDKFAFDDYDVKLLTSYDSQIFFERFHRYLIKYLDNDRVNS